jgi:hypothetical protein
MHSLVGEVVKTEAIRRAETIGLPVGSLHMNPTRTPNARIESPKLLRLASGLATPT